MMDTSKHPGIKAESVVLIESTFKRNPKVEKKIKLSFDFKYKKDCIDIDSGQGYLSVRLNGLNESTKETAFGMSCTFVGKYRRTKEPNMEIGKFLSEYAPAHLFPYIREYVSSVSMRSGIPAIILPPLNIRTLLDLDKEVEGNINDITKTEPEIQNRK